MSSNQRFVRPRRPTIDRFSLILIIVFVVLAIIVGIVAFSLVSNLVKSTTSIDLPGAPVMDGNNVAGNQPIPQGTEYVAPLQEVDAGPTAQPWDGASRVTILLMGLDYRDWEAGESPRTDTMILLTVDPLSKTAGMLSIPRDMWVNIPGSGYGKINTAYFIGDSQKLPGGGPGLAMETVEDFIGVPINYYAQIDFYAFERFIDSMGGLDMHIRESITVDPLGPGNTVTLEPGVQTLSGAVALAYARQRYTEGGDFDRSKRQQEVIMAIRDQVMNFNMLPTLVAKSPELYAELQAGIHTNLNLTQVIQLAYLAQQIDPANIKRGIIGTDMVTFGKSPDGLDIEKPLTDKIRILRDEIFTTGGPLSPAAVAADTAELARQEAARIQVQNGSQTPGLAEQTTQFFQSQGLTLVAPGNADRAYSQTVLIDYSGKPYTLSRLAELMNVDTNNIYSRYDPNAQVDVVVIVGEDWARSNPMQ
ncbi:MAG TPA: LCP family protein [Anaerolineaceae bacterium]